MNIEKGKTINGYAKTSRLFRKITLMLCKGWRYFFMVNANESNKIIIKDIYVIFVHKLSPPIVGDDGITAQLLHCFQAYLYVGFL